MWQIITELVSTRQNHAELGTRDKLQNARLILAKFQFKPEDAQEGGTLVLGTKLEMAPHPVKGQLHIKYMHIEGIQRPINIICTSSHNFYTCPCLKPVIILNLFFSAHKLADKWDILVEKIVIFDYQMLRQAFET